MTVQYKPFEAPQVVLAAQLGEDRIAVIERLQDTESPADNTNLWLLNRLDLIGTRSAHAMPYRSAEQLERAAFVELSEAGDEVVRGYAMGDIGNGAFLAWNDRPLAPGDALPIDARLAGAAPVDEAEVTTPAAYSGIGAVLYVTRAAVTHACGASAWSDGTYYDMLNGQLHEQACWRRGEVFEVTVLNGDGDPVEAPLRVYGDPTESRGDAAVREYLETALDAPLKELWWFDRHDWRRAELDLEEARAAAAADGPA